MLEKPVDFNSTFFRKKIKEDGMNQVGERFFSQFKILSIKGKGNAGN